MTTEERIAKFRGQMNGIAECEAKAAAVALRTGRRHGWIALGCAWLQAVMLFVALLSDTVNWTGVWTTGASGLFCAAAAWVIPWMAKQSAQTWMKERERTFQLRDTGIETIRVFYRCMEDLRDLRDTEE